MESTNSTQKTIDLQKRVVGSSFGLANAMCDQFERLADIYRPNWVTPDINELSQMMFRQSREWLASAKDATLSGFEYLEESLETCRQ